MRLLQARGIQGERLESDRESLPFPRGGVFGAPAERSGSPAEDLGAGILETIDRMQADLDSLESEFGREMEGRVSDIAGRIRAAREDDDYRPPAA